MRYEGPQVHRITHCQPNEGECTAEEAVAQNEEEGEFEDLRGCSNPEGLSHDPFLRKSGQQLSRRMARHGSGQQDELRKVRQHLLESTDLQHSVHHQAAHDADHAEHDMGSLVALDLGPNPGQGIQPCAMLLHREQDCWICDLRLEVVSESVEVQGQASDASSTSVCSLLAQFHTCPAACIR